ncbi:hypothetical protein ANDO1_0730 [plant metagenome]|uniref:YagK/YfjJ C-terminal domain-containing protein n=1 Tax=plant metagenome TaxID=1297885 RepID=A0A484Q3B5_9ZZZZ
MKDLIERCGNTEGIDHSGEADGSSSKGNDTVPIRMLSDEGSDIEGIIENLDRNMGLASTLDGKNYQVGISVKQLSSLIRFMGVVNHTDDLPYEIKVHANGVVEIRECEMASYMDLLPAFGRLLFEDLALSPDLALFHRIYHEHEIKRCQTLFGMKVADQDCVGICNDFVMVLRAEGQRIGIKRLIRNWQRNADENAKRLTIYMDALHDRYARLMVIRLELMYRQTACRDLEQATAWGEKLKESHFRAYAAMESGELPDDDGDDLPRVDIFTMTNDWRHFKDNMRGKPSLFRHMVGYVASIEFSSTGGHHMHVALIFDGSQVKQHEWLGDQIGQYWVEVTGGRGYFHNCNRGSYKYPGTGLINHHDEMKRQNLMRTLMYLAKKDQFVRVKASPKSKTFMTGHLPEPPTGRTGRPRVKGAPGAADEAHPRDDGSMAEAA